jgi:DNA-binding response OmpR family regulator
METIFLVEDDKNLHALIKHAIEEEGFTCVSALDGIEASQKFSPDFSLVILDVMLPGKDGWTLLRQFKQYGMKVIMLTARAQEEDKLFGFELGAMDYLTKPFSMKELMARIKVHLNASSISKKTLKNAGLIKIDEEKRKVFINDILIQLNLKEFDLLKTFIDAKGNVLSRDHLLSAVWGYDYFGDTRTVDTHIKRLRKKIAPLDYIKTIHGVGYQFEVNDEPFDL